MLVLACGKEVTTVETHRFENVTLEKLCVAYSRGDPLRLTVSGGEGDDQKSGSSI